jgi:hypothetical protein
MTTAMMKPIGKSVEIWDFEQIGVFLSLSGMNVGRVDSQSR